MPPNSRDSHFQSEILYTDKLVIGVKFRDCEPAAPQSARAGTETWEWVHTAHEGRSDQLPS